MTMFEDLLNWRPGRSGNKPLSADEREALAGALHVFETDERAVREQGEGEDTRDEAAPPEPARTFDEASVLDAFGALAGEETVVVASEDEGPKRGSAEILDAALAAGPFEGVDIELIHPTFRHMVGGVRNALLVSAYEFVRFGDKESRERFVYAEFQYAALLTKMEGWMTPKRNPLHPSALDADPRAADRKEFLLTFEGRDRALMREMESAFLREGNLRKHLADLKEKMPEPKRDLIGHLANLPFVRLLRGTFLVFALAALASDSLPTEDRRKTEGASKPQPDDGYGEPGAPIDPSEAEQTEASTIEIIVPIGGTALQTVRHLIAETPNSPWLASWIDAQYAKAREQGFNVSTRERRVEFLTQSLGLYRPEGEGALSANVFPDATLRVVGDRIELTSPGRPADVLASERLTEVTGYRGDLVKTK